MPTSPADTTQASPAASEARRTRREDEQRTLRNAGVVVASRVLHVAAATLFAIAVPRLLGPVRFGRYALLTSVSEWFGQLSGLGVFSLVTRVVPQLIASGRSVDTDRLFTNLFAWRLVTAMAVAAVYSIIVLAWLDEPDALAAALIAAALPGRILANVCFGLFLGRNQAVRWTAGDLLQRWLLLVLVVLGAVVGGLRGACAGYFLASLVVLLVGVVGTRRSLRWELLDPTMRYLRPYLRIGLSYAAAHATHMIALRSGTVVVRLATGSYLQVGYFGAAMAMYQMGGSTMWQLALSLTPFFVARFHAGDRAAVAGWLERLLVLFVLGAVLVNLAVLFVGADLLPRLLGADYAPIVATVTPLAAALVPFACAAIGRMAALIVDRPRVAAAAGAAELAAAWIAGVVLAARQGAPGAALGVLVATCVWAAIMLWPLRAVLPVSMKPALKALALGAAFTPVALLRGGPAVNAALLLASAGAYLALAVRLHIVSPRDLETLRHLARRRASADRAAALADE